MFPTLDPKHYYLKVIDLEVSHLSGSRASPLSPGGPSQEPTRIRKQIGST